jgi:hypothetical protein
LQFLAFWFGVARRGFPGSVVPTEGKKSFGPYGLANPLLKGATMAINRNDVLIKRAIQIEAREAGAKPGEVPCNGSDVEEFDDYEYVVLRNNSEILSVFRVDGWQVERLNSENWPDCLLEEAGQEAVS